MTLNIDEIAEMLIEMRADNDNNAESFEKFLSLINNKLEFIADDNEAAELIKVYITELKNSIDEKHSDALSKLNNIRNSFENLISLLDENAKTQEIRDLFSFLNSNISAFTKSLTDQQNKIDNINFSEYSALIRNDIKSISSKIEDIPASIEFQSIEEKLSDFAEIILSLKEYIGNLNIENSGLINANFQKLEDEFANIVTDSDFSGFRKDLGEFVQKIIDNTSILNEELSFSTERIENILATIKTLDFREDFQDVISRLEEIKDIFNENSNVNYTNLSNEIIAISAHLDESFNSLDNSQKDIFFKIKENLAYLSADVIKLIELNPQKSLDELTSVTSKIAETVNILKNDLTGDFSNRNKEIKDALSTMITNLQLIKEEVNRNYSFLHLSDKKFDNLEERFNALITEITTVKAEINETEKVGFNDIALSFDSLSENISNLLEDFNDNVNSNYEAIRNYSEELISKTDLLRENFKELSDENCAQIIQKLTDVSDEVVLFHEKFKQAVQSDLENSSRIISDVETLSEKVETYNDNITFISGQNFDSIKELFENLTEEFQVQKEFLEDNKNNKLQKIEILQKFSQDITNIESAVKAGFLENKEELVNNIAELKLHVNDLISSAVKTNSDLSENFLNEVCDINNAISSLKNIITVSSQEAASDVIEQLKIIEEHLVSSVTGNDFTVLKNEIVAFIQRVSDNAEVLNLDVNANRDLLTQIQTSLNLIDYHTDFELISDKLNEINTYLNNSEINVSAKFNELKNKLTQINENCVQNIESLNTLKNDITNNFDIRNNLSELKETGEIQLDKINNILTSSKGLKLHLDEVFESLRNYIAEVNTANQELKSQTDDGFSRKLIDMEAQLSANADLYNEKIQSLQAKLSEYIQLSEVRSVNSDALIESSVNEIVQIKESLNTLYESLKSSKVNIDGRFENVIEAIDNSLENTIINLERMPNEISSSVKISLEENFNEIEKNFSNLAETLEQINSNQEKSNDVIICDLQQKSEGLMQEIQFVNSDLKEAFCSKSEDIQRAFEAIKSDIELVSQFDFKKPINMLKEQLETAFVNLSVDINSELASNSELSHKLQQVLKDLSDKITSVDEYISENVATQFEMLGIKNDTNTNEIKLLIEDKFFEYTDDLKFHIDNNCVETTKTALCDLKSDLGLKIGELICEQENIVTQNNAIAINIQTLGKTLEKYNNFDDLNKELNNINEKLGKPNSEIIDKLNSVSDKLEIADDIALSVDLLNSKIDIISSDISNNLADDEIITAIKELNSKVDILASDNTAEDIQEEVAESLNVLNSKIDIIASDLSMNELNDKIDDLSDTKSNLTKMLSELNSKVDILALDNNDFEEETEFIKDFVEEKTDVINKQLSEVHNQLKQIANEDYSYTLQDVESDIAKLRIAIQESSSQDENFIELSENINKIVQAVDTLEASLTQDEIFELKNDIEKLNDDILSLSSRTNKLLLTSDESYKTIQEGLDTFSNLIVKLDTKINSFENSTLQEKIEYKLNNITSALNTALNSDKVFHQVLMYLGEWIDSTTENILNICEKTSQISDVKNAIAQLKEEIPDKADILDRIEKRFEQQEVRIDRLEMKIEKILSTLEEKDDMMLNIKVDNIENILSVLSANIEKLTSYVDEE